MSDANPWARTFSGIRVPLSLLVLISAATILLAGNRPTASSYGAAAPSLRFSTYYGGGDVEISAAVDLDANGYVYTSGLTTSSDLVTPNALFGFSGGVFVGSDMYVAKYSPGGDTLVWGTYVGGSSDDMVADLVVANDGAVYFAGSTSSSDFPVPNSVFPFRGGGVISSDGFVARISADATALDFGSFIGGDGDDAVSALALDDDGNLYLAGTTTSDDFPTTTGAFKETRTAGDEGMDAFVLKLRPDGGAFALDYATYLGGTGSEAPVRIAVDGDGGVWVIGFTTSTDFPTRNALQPSFGGPIRDLEGDVFLSRLSPDGAALSFSTYLGGRQSDQGTGLALDDEGNVFLAGWTDSNDFPTTPGTYQTERSGIRDAFVMKLVRHAADSWSPVYATRFGSPGHEMGRISVQVDKAGRVWLGGTTTSADFRTVDPVQIGYGGGEHDAFLARLEADGSVLGFATLLGGSEADVLAALALGNDAVCAVGSTGSGDFPTTGAVQSAFDGPLSVGRKMASTFMSCFDITNESSQLTRMAVSPDTANVGARRSVRFTADGFDQFGQPLSVVPEWSATGGTIDSTGLYTAGDDIGFFAVTATDPGTSVAASAVVNINSGVGAESPDASSDDVPDAFALHAAYPNPFGEMTTIAFDVKAPVRVVLTIYDALGRRRETMIATEYGPGRHTVPFDGRLWSSGVYFYEIEMGEFRDVKRMIVAH